MPWQSLTPVTRHRAWGQRPAHSSLAQPVPIQEDGTWHSRPAGMALGTILLPKAPGYWGTGTLCHGTGLWENRGTGGVQVEQGESGWGWVWEPNPSHARALQSSRVRPSPAVAPWREMLVLMLSKSTWIVQSRPLCPHLEIIVFIGFRETVHGIKRFWQEPTSERPITTV